MDEGQIHAFIMHAETSKQRAAISNCLIIHYDTFFKRNESL